jgi:hypothetical protein
VDASAGGDGGEAEQDQLADPVDDLDPGAGSGQGGAAGRKITELTMASAA